MRWVIGSVGPGLCRPLWLKKVLLWSGCMGFVLLASAQVEGPGFHLVGIPSLGVPVTVSKMTNLVFPVPVAAGVKVSRDVLAQKPKGVENVIELKAVRRDFAPTNLSVYGVDGRLYSFDLRYVADTSVLNYRVVASSADCCAALAGVGSDSIAFIRLAGLPVDLVGLEGDAAVLAARRGYLHRSAYRTGVGLRLKGVYLRDSLMWLSLRVRNQSKIVYRPASLRIYIEDRKQVRRMAGQEVAVRPVYSGRLVSVAGDSSWAFSVGLEPMVLDRGKNLVIELGEAGGSRTMVLRVKGRVLLRVRE